MVIEYAYYSVYETKDRNEWLHLINIFRLNKINWNINYVNERFAAIGDSIDRTKMK